MRFMVSETHPVIVVPTYNEAENLPVILAAIHENLPEAEVLVVDDNSPDGTGQIADAAAEKVSWIHVLHRTEKAGLGKAYLAGFEWALKRDYTHVFEMDADLSHPPEKLETYWMQLARRILPLAAVG